jgi:hypothetical protein
MLESEFRPLSEFKQIVETYRPNEQELARLERGDTWRLRCYKFWLEAFLAAEFARRSGQRDALLRLMPAGSSGDFQLRNGTAEHLYELTEVLDEEERRRRAKFTRAERCKAQQLSDDQVSGALARRMIPQRIAEKAANPRYSPETELIIYVNLETDFERNGTHGLLPATDIQFKAIWLLAEQKALRIFPRNKGA